MRRDTWRGWIYGHLGFVQACFACRCEIRSPRITSPGYLNRITRFPLLTASLPSPLPEITMTFPAHQSKNDPLYLKGPVPWGPPYFLRPFVSTSTDVESLKGGSIIASFHSTVDRSSTTSLGLGIREYQATAANEYVGTSPINPCSHSLDAVRPSTAPVFHTGIAEGDRGSLGASTASTLGESDPSCYRRSDVSYRDTPPFRKWMRSFRRKGPKYRAITYPIEDATIFKDEDTMSNIPSSKAGTKTPSSSMRFVTAVKTASNTFTSLSITGGSARRKSSGGTLDDATVMRMRDRKCALEELINTEEYYIADLKVLMNVSCRLHIYSCFLFIIGSYQP